MKTLIYVILKIKNTMDTNVLVETISNYIYYEQKHFIDRIKTVFPECKTDFIFDVELDVYNRCLARVWDSKTECNPNLRCTQNALPNTIFCKKHLAKGSCGRIDEMPDEFSVMRFYRKNDPNVDSKIDLEHTLETVKIKKKIKNNILYNNTDNQMSIADVIDKIDDMLKTYTVINNDTILDIKHKLIDKYNLVLSMNDTILLEKHIIEKSKTSPPKKRKIIIKKKVEQAKAENNEALKINTTNPIIKNSKLFKHLITKEPVEEEKEMVQTSPKDETALKLKLLSYDSHSETVDISGLDSVLITDGEFNQSELFINSTKLYNIQGKLCGYVKDWVDEEDEVPEDFKTSDNIVLNPWNNLPIQEYYINSIGSIYCGLVSSTYREYTYDSDMDSFRKNTNINR